MDEKDETNILDTELIWIEGRCYRKIPIKGSDKKTYNYDQEDLFPTHPSESINEEENVIEDLPVKHDGNKFWITIYVPGPLIKFVCGKQQRRRKGIEDSTHTSIKLPSDRESFTNSRDRYSRKNEESGDVVITGATKDSVSIAYRKIEDIINSGRWKVCSYTHFISIPMNNDSIQKGFLKFKEDVLKKCCSARGISSEIFVDPATLHLTIAMLTLFDDKDKELAKATVNKCKAEINNIFHGKTINAQVKGIEYMNDDPGEVDVLYGIVRETDNDNALQLIAEKLSKSLIEVNLAKKEYDFVKLHVTLMKSRSTEEERKSFDARPLLQKFPDYVFGEMTVSEIHISVRYTGKAGSYYTSAAVINL